MKYRYLTLVLSTISLVLILLSPARDFTSNVTLLLGTVLVVLLTILTILSSSVLVLTPFQIRAISLLRIVGATLALGGVFVGTLIAPFSGFIPFLYYFVLSAFVLGQLLLSAQLINIEL